jgi:oligoendopeptidase F
VEKVYIEKFDFRNISSVENHFQDLLQKDLSSTEVLISWLKDVSEFYDAIEEVMEGHYIDFQAYNNDESAKQTYEYDQKKLNHL